MRETQIFRENWIRFVHEIQDQICHALELADGQAAFHEDEWQRNPDGSGGGGKTRIIADGKLIEKGGVNTSVVFGSVSEKMRLQLKIDGEKWFACGISLVIHPLNPYVPTTHANWRYFELYDQSGNIKDRWFGGGADLTPYYLFEEDATHFHQTLKSAIDPFGIHLYPSYKKACDEYFSNSHRNNEMRGIGGVFYDYLRPVDEKDAERLFSFQQENANAFLRAYMPIIERRRYETFGEKQIEWQQIRRGRYVEFNLIHDRGTLFGLKTNGRTESILMSLPPRARWVYDHQPVSGSQEDKLLQACLHPRDWV
ncbi:MAG: oxygen-dependent coproporphyrinogen oxidase [Bacteroidetes bacterium]|nr:MAG: oxygen-dependent coproporphyrinogen oxidase [Bacteroidota bacterium]